AGMVTDFPGWVLVRREAPTYPVQPAEMSFFPEQDPRHLHRLATFPFHFQRIRPSENSTKSARALVFCAPDRPPDQLATNGGSHRGLSTARGSPSSEYEYLPAISRQGDYPASDPGIVGRSFRP